MGAAQQLADFGLLPLEAQERAMVDDLVAKVMWGCPGRYIYLDDGRLHIPPTLDTSLAELTTRMLPLYGHANVVLDFTRAAAAAADLPFPGLVLQALAEAVRHINKEYHILVCQIDTQRRAGALSLQRTWGYMQETVDTMRALADVIMTIQTQRLAGAAVLSMLHNRAVESVRYGWRHPLRCIALHCIAGMHRTGWCGVVWWLTAPHPCQNVQGRGRAVAHGPPAAGRRPAVLRDARRLALHRQVWCVAPSLPYPIQARASVLDK
jgi:hypothetical protein